MHNQYTDFEELRPTGEASHVPDTRLDDGCEGDPQWQRVATSAGGYPDAVEFVNQVEANAQFQAVYDEYSVVARIDGSRIVGDIDRLLVTPDAYHIVNYKTNNLSLTSTTELATHCRPQMLAYALALLQHDSDRVVRASLRFTDVGVEEQFEWVPSELHTIESEVRSMMEMIGD